MARPLKVFTVHGHASHIPPGIINDVLGAPSHIQQGGIFVVARTKKDAAQFLGDKLGGRYKTSEIDEATGNHITAFLDATRFLCTTSDVYEGKIAVSWGQGSQGYAVETFINGWEVVGETTHKDPANPHLFLQKPIFVPANAPAKPVRITIELDADSDASIVAELIKAGKVFLEPSVDSGRFVLGKVVES